MPRPIPNLRSLLVLAVASGCLLSGGRAYAVDDELSALIEDARVSYQPVTEQEVEAARSELARAVEAFERFLVPGSRKGEAWKEYLLWENVQQALSDSEQTDLNALRNSLDKFRFGAEGTQLAPFRQVAEAMERYVNLASVVRARDQQAFVNEQLDLLEQYLDRYQDDSSTRARFEIERRLDFFSGIGRAPALTRALRDRFSKANVQADISERFVSRAVARPIDDVGPVSDCILGTTIRGTGHTTGHVTADIIPSSQRAVVVLRAQGVTRSQTRGYNDPVVIRSRGTTPFEATKRVEIADDNFWNYPTTVRATTSTVTCSVEKQGGGLGSAIVERIGERRVEENKSQANYIAARHAEDRIAREFDDEVLPQLQDARYEYLNQFKKAFDLRNAGPEYVLFSSTDQSMHVHMLQAGPGSLGAETTPPPFSAGHDLTVRMHETGATNVASALLAGATLSQDSREEDAELNIELPDWLQEVIDEAREESQAQPADEEDREFKPWSMLFRRLRPLTVEFADDLVKLRLHATRITVGSDTYDGWDILVNYTLNLENGGLRLEREGAIEVIPTTFDPAEGDRLSNRQVGLRGNLARELNRQAEAGRGFPKELEIEAIDLPDDIEHIGPLLMQDVRSGSGWLSLGWRLPH